MKRFSLITEADARRLDVGSTVELERGGHVTPLARDTLRERRVTLLEAGAGMQPAPSLFLAPEIRRLAVAADHTGVGLKRAVVDGLRSRGLQVWDLGVDRPDPVDYPDVAAWVVRRILTGETDAGIVIDGAGLGSAIAANKFPGIRAVACQDARTARYAREHNGSNVLTLGATLLQPEAALDIVDGWLSSALREPRYLARIEKLARLEQQIAQDWPKR